MYCDEAARFPLALIQGRSWSEPHRHSHRHVCSKKEFKRTSGSASGSMTFTKIVVKMSEDLDTSEIRNWRSIATLIVFVLTSE
jgi:hypothetical protein